MTKRTEETAIEKSMTATLDKGRADGQKLLAALHDPKRKAELLKLLSPEGMAEAARSQSEAMPLGGRFVKTEGGEFSFSGIDLGPTIRCVVVGSVYHNRHMAEKWKPGNKNSHPPTCYAFGRKLADMVAVGNPDTHCERCTDAEGTPCCPLNEFGSADEGEGKACQNIIRLAILPAGDGAAQLTEGTFAQELMILHVPILSVRTFGAYVKNLEREYAKPTWAFVTEISLAPGTKTGGRKGSGGFSMGFKVGSEIPENLLLLVAERLGKVDAVLRTAYPAPRDDAPKAKGKKGSK